MSAPTKSFRDICQPTLLFLCVLAFATLPITSFSATLPAPERLRIVVPGGADPGPDAVTKWYPGHYVFLGPRHRLPNMLTHTQDMAIVRGAQLSYYWEDLEPRKDQYDFSLIHEDIALLREHGKLLVIQLQYKSFFPERPGIPDYLKSAAYEGGSYQNHKGYWDLRLWNENVRTRFHALIRALGEQFDSNPTVAALNTEESGPAVPKSSDPLAADWPSYRDGYFEGLVGLAPVFREAFGRTPVIFYFNSGPNEANLLAAAINKYGVGVGGPDTYTGTLAHDLWLKHSYGLASQVQGLAPIGYAVQWDNYVHAVRNKVVHDTENPIPELYAFSRSVLGSNFVFWARRPDFWDKLKEFLGSLDHKNPAGGLSSQCPTMLAPCGEAK